MARDRHRFSRKAESLNSLLTAAAFLRVERKRPPIRKDWWPEEVQQFWLES
jgi:hypothetical protein